MQWKRTRYNCLVFRSELSHIPNDEIEWNDRGLAISRSLSLPKGCYEITHTLAGPADENKILVDITAISSDAENCVSCISSVGYVTEISWTGYDVNRVMLIHNTPERNEIVDTFVKENENRPTEET